MGGGGGGDPHICNKFLWKNLSVRKLLVKNLLATAIAENGKKPSVLSIPDALTIFIAHVKVAIMFPLSVYLCLSLFQLAVNHTAA